MANMFGWLEVHAVDHCNHNCRWCHNYSPFAPQKIYEAKEYFDGLDVLNKNNIQYNSLSIMGGEPFLHPDLIGFAYTLFGRYRKPLMLTTNGFWLSIDDIHIYKDLWPIIFCLRMSRYPTIIRRLGGLQKVKELLNSIKIYNPNIRIDFCDKTSFNKLEFWNNPKEIQVYCGNVECTALLPDMRMGRCGAGAYTHFAPKGIIPETFLNSREMFYNLKKFDRDSFWLWRKRYPLDACQYCNFSQKLRSGHWKVEKGRKPFNEDVEQLYHIQKAASMLSNGDLECCEKRIKYIEHNYEAGKECKNLAGIIKYRKGDYHSANEYFMKALEHDPEYLPALRNIKAIIQKKGKVVTEA
jgi:hypothetical protein